jgi:hypothetical protein
LLVEFILRNGFEEFPPVALSRFSWKLPKAPLSCWGIVSFRSLDIIGLPLLDA